jgi:hypothetical protein
MAATRGPASSLAHHRIDYDAITGQTFFDNTWRQWSTFDALFLAGFTGSLLAFGHPHEVFSRFDIELLSALVADQRRLFATVTADALLRCTSNDLFYPRQIRRQFLTARMFARLLERQF